MNIVKNLDTCQKPATLLKVTLLYGCFSRFLHCTNGTKLYKWHTHTHSLHGLTYLNPCIEGVRQQSFSIWLYHSSLFILAPNVLTLKPRKVTSEWIFSSKRFFGRPRDVDFTLNFKTLKTELVYFTTGVPAKSDTSVIRVRHEQHECDTSDTSATQTTQVQYEC